MKVKEYDYGGFDPGGSRVSEEKIYKDHLDEKDKESETSYLGEPVRSKFNLTIGQIPKIKL